ncbi:MAG: hypothetical protein JW904_10850 [Spirochaetales bacterium]|nr:hypothetical protein [Spirochaetales bacterium]
MNGYIYISGGRQSGTTDFNTVEYAQLSPTGGVGSFTLSVNTFTNAREHAPTIGYNNYFYIFGGYTIEGATDIFDDIQYAAIDGTTGAIGEFTVAAESLLEDTRQHSVGIHNDILYSIGGQNVMTTAYAAFAP